MLARESGILSFLVKGGRNPRCPFRTVLAPLTLSEIVFRTRPGHDLHFLKDASLRAHFPKLRARLESIAAAEALAEIWLKIAHTSAPHEEFDLLEQALTALEAEAPPATVFAHALKSLCSVLGYSPELESCTLCGAPLSAQGTPADIWFASGGAVCATCLGERKPLHTREAIAQILGDQFSAPPVGEFYLQHLRTHTGTLSVLKGVDFFKFSSHVSLS
jgi:DNA repair protein RecO (recombination protein O)